MTAGSERPIRVLVADDSELFRVLLARVHCVSGGTVEIQRNIIGERTLGLPK